MSSPLTTARQKYEAGAKLLNRAQPLLLLGVRLYWGWQFFLTGQGKLMNIDRTAEFFAGIGIPLPVLNAYAAGTVECVGGLLLAAGVLSRLTAIPLMTTMLVAYGTAHRDVVETLFSNPDGFVTAAPFLFLLASLIVLIFGPGPLSVDGLLARSVLSDRKLNIPEPLSANAAIVRQ
jgi:putative oxidoreductase